MLHDYEVYAYRVTKWTVDDRNFNISLAAATSNTETIQMRGRYTGFTLRVEISGTNGLWKRNDILKPGGTRDCGKQGNQGRNTRVREAALALKAASRGGLLRVDLRPLISQRPIFSLAQGQSAPAAARASGGVCHHKYVINDSPG
jgi:hypothetical protein